MDITIITIFILAVFVGFEIILSHGNDFEIITKSDLILFLTRLQGGIDASHMVSG